jgi:hypothetical protein
MHQAKLHRETDERQKRERHQSLGKKWKKQAASNKSYSIDKVMLGIRKGKPKIEGRQKNTIESKRAAKGQLKIRPAGRPMSTHDGNFKLEMPAMPPKRSTRKRKQPQVIYEPSDGSEKNISAPKFKKTTRPASKAVVTKIAKLAVREESAGEKSTNDTALTILEVSKDTALRSVHGLVEAAEELKESDVLFALMNESHAIDSKLASYRARLAEISLSVPKDQMGRDGPYLVQSLEILCLASLERKAAIRKQLQEYDKTRAKALTDEEKCAPPILLPDGEDEEEEEVEVCTHKACPEYHQMPLVWDTDDPGINSKQSGVWDDWEHNRLVSAFLHLDWTADYITDAKGKDWVAVSELIKVRCPTQCRTHHQKWVKKDFFPSEMESYKTKKLQRKKDWTKQKKSEERKKMLKKQRTTPKKEIPHTPIATRVQCHYNLRGSLSDSLSITCGTFSTPEAVLYPTMEGKLVQPMSPPAQIEGNESHASTTVNMNMMIPAAAGSRSEYHAWERLGAQDLGHVALTKPVPIATRYREDLGMLEALAELAVSPRLHHSESPRPSSLDCGVRLTESGVLALAVSPTSVTDMRTFGDQSALGSSSCFKSPSPSPMSPARCPPSSAMSLSAVRPTLTWLAECAMGVSSSSVKVKPWVAISAPIGVCMNVRGIDFGPDPQSVRSPAPTLSDTLPKYRDVLQSEDDRRTPLEVGGHAEPKTAAQENEQLCAQLHSATPLEVGGHAEPKTAAQENEQLCAQLYSTTAAAAVDEIDKSTSCEKQLPTTSAVLVIAAVLASDKNKAAQVGLSAYELQRLKNIRRNELMMQSLGLGGAARGGKKKARSARKMKAKARQTAATGAYRTRCRKRTVDKGDQ